MQAAKVREAITGMQIKNLNDEVVQVRENNHVDKQALIARIIPNGQLIVVSESPVIVAQS